MAAIGPRFTLFRTRKERDCGKEVGRTKVQRDFLSRSSFRVESHNLDGCFLILTQAEVDFGASTAQFLLRFWQNFIADEQNRERCVDFIITEAFVGSSSSWETAKTATSTCGKEGPGTWLFGNGLPEWRNLTTSLERFHFVVFSAAGKPESKSNLAFRSSEDSQRGFQAESGVSFSSFSRCSRVSVLMPAKR